MSALPIAAEFAAVRRSIAWITNVPPRRIEELAIASFVYAAVFIVEGVGLWFGKVWAEWFTVVVTSSLIPFEAHEVVKKPTVLRIAFLIANIAIVIYLVHRRRTVK